MTEGFDGRDVVITGGTGVLGRSVVQNAAAAGARCHVPCFDSSELADLPWSPSPSIRITEGVDLTREQDVVAFYGGLDRLWASIHCAGGFSMGPFAETGEAQLDRLWKLNFVSCFLCCREAAVAMRRAPDAGGRIVNVAARPALEPRLGAGMTAYSVSKGAVATLTVALAEELAAESIWVNAVAPAIIDTPANREAMPDADWSRWTAPDEVASTILFLASSANRSTRGTVAACYGRG